ncbi:MAG: acyl-ACP--UDP-N-acetylglucosamine O-acyltransferase [Candidatus Firestonebacteria bacterium]
MKIHSTAIIYPKAKLSETVEIGPYTIIGENVEIGDNTKISSSVVIEGNTKIGKNNILSVGVVIGTPPQDVKYKGETSYLEIGDNNVIREYVTIHKGTGEGGKTIIGNDNFIMTYSHIGHNCIVGNEITMVNYAALGGYVIVEDKAVISAFAAIHQFCRIGRLAMIGASSKLVKDVPPYLIADGHPLAIYGLNSVGLKRRNVPLEIRHNLENAYKIIYRSDLNLSQAIAKIETEIPKSEEINHFIEFLKTSKRGICLDTSMR